MLVLLDKDGVINEDIPDTGVIRPDQLKLIDGAAEGIANLNRLGVKVAIVTNQSAVGKGLITEKQCQALLDQLREMLREKNADWDACYYCTDAPDKPTRRRKPEPGMLSEALRDFNATPAHTPLVGDALRDLQAASAAGCPRYLVRTGKGEETLESGLVPQVQPTILCEDLKAAVGRIVQDFQFLLPRQ